MAKKVRKLKRIKKLTKHQPGPAFTPAPRPLPRCLETDTVAWNEMPSLPEGIVEEHPEGASELSRVSRLLQDYEYTITINEDRARSFLVSRYKSVFGVASPPGLHAEIVKGRLISYFQWAGYKANGKEEQLTLGFWKNFRAVWSPEAEREDYSRFEADIRLVFEVEKERKDRKMAKKAESEGAAPAGPVKKVTLQHRTANPKGPILESGSRFKENHHRHKALLVIIDCVKRGLTKPQVIDALKDTKVEFRGKQKQLVPGHFNSCLASHPDFVEVYSDGSMKVIKEPVPAEASVKKAPEKKAPVKKPAPVAAVSAKAPVKKAHVKKPAVVAASKAPVKKVAKKVVKK